jgi:hypothetical protein
MALIHSPNIVTNGLLLYLDAPNPKSTTGTIWKDISGNNIPVTIQGGADSSSNVTNKSMYLNFNPSTYNADNSFYRITDSRVANLTTNLTLETCVYIHEYKPNDPNFNFRPVSPRLAGVVSPYGFSIMPNRNGRLGGISQEINTGPSYTWNVSEDVSVPTSIIDFNKWIHVTQVQDDTAKTFKTYVNGQLRTSLTYVGSPNTQSGYTGLDIGRGYYVTNQSFPGRIAFVRLYNRPLTEVEIKQNYNATQERFSREGLVIDSSLKLWLDADNNQSYSGTGSTWFDLSGTGNNGTIQSGVTYNALGWFDFTANTGYVSLPNQPTGFSYGAAAGTICGWFKTSGNTGFILSYGTSSTNAARYIGFISGSYYAGVWTNDLVLGSPTVALNTWTHMAEVYDGTTLYLYLNGVRVASGVRTLNTTAGTAYIGALTNLDRSSNKSIAQVQVYNRALNDNEIRQNYNALRERFGL